MLIYFDLPFGRCPRLMHPDDRRRDFAANRESLLATQNLSSSHPRTGAPLSAEGGSSFAF